MKFTVKAMFKPMTFEVNGQPEQLNNIVAALIMDRLQNADPKAIIESFIRDDYQYSEGETRERHTEPCYHTLGVDEYLDELRSLVRPTHSVSTPLQPATEERWFSTATTITMFHDLGLEIPEILADPPPNPSV